MQGYLLKLGSGVYRRWQRRYFIWDGNQLCYFVHEKDYREGKPPHHKLGVQGAKVQLVTVSPDGTKFDSEEHKTLCFEIDQGQTEKNQKTKYHLVAPDILALKKWMHALSEARQDKLSADFSNSTNTATTTTEMTPLGDDELEGLEGDASVSRMIERPRSLSQDPGERKVGVAVPTFRAASPQQRHSMHEPGTRRLVDIPAPTELEGFRESFEITIENEIRAINAELRNEGESSDEEETNAKEYNGPTKRVRSDYVLPERLLDYFFVVVPPQFLDKNSSWDQEEQDFDEKPEWLTGGSPQDTDSEEKPSQSRNSVSHNAGSLLGTMRIRAMTLGEADTQSKLAMDHSKNGEIIINPSELAAVDVYPDKEYEGNPFDRGWIQFAFPDNSYLHSHATDQPVRCHWAVITSGTQKRTIKLYFAFLTFTEYYIDEMLDTDQDIYLPKALVLVSHYPQFEFMKYCLTEIYSSRLTVPVERVISWLISEVPLPPAGMSVLELPFSHYKLRCGLPSIQMPLTSTIPLKFLFRKLSLVHILEVFKAIMTEGRILFHSYSLTTLITVCQSFFQLIYPFEWHGIYIPLIPEGSLAACGALGPFVLGVSTDLLPEVEAELDGVLVVAVDTDTCVRKPYKQEEEVTYNMPANAFSTLTSSLRSAVRAETQRADEVSISLSAPGEVPVVDASSVAWSPFDSDVLMAFLKFFNEILSGYRKVIFRIAEGPQCNLEEFLKEKGEVIDAAAIPFITALFHSTMFTVFLERDKEYEAEPLLKVYHDYIASPRDRTVAMQALKQILHSSSGGGLAVSLVPPPIAIPLSPRTQAVSTMLLSVEPQDSKHRTLKFRRLKKENFGENLTRQRLQAPSRKFVAYRRASVGQQRSEEDESVVTIMMDLFHAKPISELDYKILTKCCMTSPQTITNIVQQSMSNKNLAGAGGLVLSPTSFVVLVFVFRYVLIVCAARNKIQHEVVNTVFEACSFYHCHELGRLSSESTDSGTLKKQRYYMSGALSHAFGGDDQRSRDFWVKLITAELKTIARTKRATSFSSRLSPSHSLRKISMTTITSSLPSPSSSSSLSSSSSSSCSTSSCASSSCASTSCASTSSSPSVSPSPSTLSSSATSAASSSSTSSCTSCSCSSSSSSSSSSSCSCPSSSSSSSTSVPIAALAPSSSSSTPFDIKITDSDSVEKRPPPPPPSRPRASHALKSPHRQTPGLQVGDIVVAKVQMEEREGVVAYLGSMGTSEAWVGISTKKGLGDCDGSRDGQVYFVCEHSSGLFVLESQVVANKGSAQEQAAAQKMDRLPQETVYHVMTTYITRMKDFRVHRATSEAACQAICDAQGMEPQLKQELIRTITMMYQMDASLEDVGSEDTDSPGQALPRSVLEKDTPVFLRGRLKVQLIVKSSATQIRRQTWADIECVLTDSCFAWIHTDGSVCEIDKSIPISTIQTIKRISKPNGIEIRPKGKDSSRVCLVLGYTVAENGRGKFPSKSLGKKELREVADRENNVVDEWFKWLKLMKIVKLCSTVKSDGAPPLELSPSQRVRERLPDRNTAIGRKAISRSLPRALRP